MDSLPYSNAIGFCSTAICKTEAPSYLSVLLKQRRRWLLGTFANEIYMFTDPVLWKSRPLLMLLRFIHNCTRSISLLLYIFLISIVTGFLSKDGIVIETPILLIAIILPLITNWIYMIYFGLTLHRYKTLLYPFFYLVHPFFSWLCFVYTIFTFNKRTWGGPRTVFNPSTSNSDKRKASILSEARSSGSRFTDDTEGEQLENEIFNMYSEEYNKTIYLSEVDKNTLYNAYGGRKGEKDIETIVNRIHSVRRNSRNHLSELFRIERGRNPSNSPSVFRGNVIASPISINSPTSYTDTIIPSKNNTQILNYDENSVHNTIIANSTNIVPTKQPFYKYYRQKGKQSITSDYSSSYNSEFSNSPLSERLHIHRESDNQTICLQQINNININNINNNMNNNMNNRN